MRSISIPGLAPLAFLAVLSCLTGCSSLPTLADLPKAAGEKFMGMLTPYRMEVVQGNVVTKEMAAKVQPGMTHAQVRDILGSPMLTDVFHAERWDYAFTIRRQGTAPQKRELVARFEGDKLKALEVPPDLPTEVEFVASINNFHPAGAAPKLELTEAQAKAWPLPPKQAAPAAPEPIGPVRSYPPLEPQT
ncbi:MAG TPA: outer membrane protein assembly factor BamE [Burkholderiaceae bacterium]